MFRTGRGRLLDEEVKLSLSVLSKPVLLICFPLFLLEICVAGGIYSIWEVWLHRSFAKSRIRVINHLLIFLKLSWVQYNQSVPRLRRKVGDTHIHRSWEKGRTSGPDPVMGCDALQIWRRDNWGNSLESIWSLCVSVSVCAAGTSPLFTLARGASLWSQRSV